MEGLIEEGNEMLKEKADPAVKDAGLISAAQRVEHYEMAGYGTVRTYAQLLGFNDAAHALQETLNEEGDTDHKLTELAESMINPAAEHESGEGMGCGSSRQRGAVPVALLCSESQIFTLQSITLWRVLHGDVEARRDANTVHGYRQRLQRFNLTQVALKYLRMICAMLC